MCVGSASWKCIAKQPDLFALDADDVKADRCGLRQTPRLHVEGRDAADRSLLRVVDRFGGIAIGLAGTVFDFDEAQVVFFACNDVDLSDASEEILFYNAIAVLPEVFCRDLFVASSEPSFVFQALFIPPRTVGSCDDESGRLRIFSVLHSGRRFHSPYDLRNRTPGKVYHTLPSCDPS